MVKIIYKNLLKSTLTSLIFLLLFPLPAKTMENNEADKIRESFKNIKIIEESIRIYKYNEAISLINKEISLNHTNGILYYYRGYCFNNLKKYYKAIEDYNKVLTLDIDSYFQKEALYNLASIYLIINNPNKSMETCYKLLKQDLNDTKAKKILNEANDILFNSKSEIALNYYKEGLSYSEQGYYITAENFFVKAIKEDPAFIGAKYELGITLVENNDLKNAISVFLEILEKARYSPRIYIQIGNAYFKTNDFDHAIVSLEQGLILSLGEVNSEYSNARNVLIKSYIKKNDFKNAIKNLEILYQISPNSIETRNELAVNYINSGEYEKGEKFLQNILLKNPDDTFANKELSNLYSTQGKHEEALKLYEKVAMLEPATSATRINLGNKYKTLKMYEKAILSYKKATSLDLANSLAFANLGETYFELKNYDAALIQYKKVLRLTPADYKAYYQTARIYSLKDKKNDAIANLEIAIELEKKCVEEIKKNDDFINLKNDQRFNELLESIP